MQTSLQFGHTSTIQEWSRFRGIVKEKKAVLKTVTDDQHAANVLIEHLTKQLGGSSVIRI